MLRLASLILFLVGCAQTTGAGESKGVSDAQAETLDVAEAPDSGDVADVLTEPPDVTEIGEPPGDAPDAAEVAPNGSPCGPCPAAWECITDVGHEGPFCGCRKCANGAAPYRCGPTGECVDDVVKLAPSLPGMHAALLKDGMLCEFSEKNPMTGIACHYPRWDVFPSVAAAADACEALTIGGAHWKWRLAGLGELARMASARCPALAECDGGWGEDNLAHCPAQETWCWPFEEHYEDGRSYWAQGIGVTYWFIYSGKGHVEIPVPGISAPAICRGVYDITDARKAAGLPVE